MTCVAWGSKDINPSPSQAPTSAPPTRRVGGLCLSVYRIVNRAPSSCPVCSAVLCI